MMKYALHLQTNNVHHNQRTSRQHDGEIMKDNLIHIALATDHRYVPGLLVTMTSMIRSTEQKSRLRFHILADALDDSDKMRIANFATDFGAQLPEFVEPDMTLIRERFTPYKNSHAAFLRLFLCELISLDWILYSDVDTLWMRDISELWSLRDDSVSLLWCRDIPSIAHGVKEYSTWNPEFNESQYACSGVALMNLKRMRETDFINKCADFVERWGTPFFVDQDILNYVCRNDAKLLPQYWDCMMPDPEAVNGIVYHFNGIGSMFNSSFTGWRPLFYPWFRFYYDFILGEPERQVCGITKRALFMFLGFLYPSSWIVTMFMPRTKQKRDSITRQLFFAWLWRKAKWRWDINNSHSHKP